MSFEIHTLPTHGDVEIIITVKHLFVTLVPENPMKILEIDADQEAGAFEDDGATGVFCISWDADLLMVEVKSRRGCGEGGGISLAMEFNENSLQEFHQLLHKWQKHVSEYIK